MSALTKVFVVLLVILSLLLAAASITFLYTVPDYNSRIEVLNQSVAAAKAESSNIQSQVEAQKAAAERRAAELQAQLTSADTQVTNLRTELAKAEADKAALESQITLAGTTQSTLANAVTLNLGLVNELREQLAGLRENSDRTLQQNLELSTELARLQNEYEYTQRALRAAQEQNVDLLGQAEQMRGIIVALGGNPDRLEQNPVAPPPINGVVVQRQDVGGQPYALISVGSEDDVQSGMRFTIIDTESSQLIGFLTVEEVDDQVSIGKLSGPRINEVGPNDQVRTRV